MASQTINLAKRLGPFQDSIHLFFRMPSISLQVLLPLAGLLSELVQGRELCLSCSVVETMGVFQLFLNHPFEISKESQWLYKLLCSGSHHQLGWSSGKRNPSATCLALGHLRGMMQCEQIHQIYEKHLWLGLLNTGRLRRVLVPYATVATYRKTEHNPSLHARLCRSLHHICLCFW